MCGCTKGISQCLWKPTARFLCIINRNPHSLLEKGLKKTNVIKSKHPELPWSALSLILCANTQTNPTSYMQMQKHTHTDTHYQASSRACRPTLRWCCWQPTVGYQRSSWRSPGLWDSVAPSIVFKTLCPGALLPGAVTQSHGGGA